MDAEDELEQFRNQWRNELASARAASGIGDEARVKRPLSPDKPKPKQQQQQQQHDSDPSRSTTDKTVAATSQQPAVAPPQKPRKQVTAIVDDSRPRATTRAAPSSSTVSAAALPHSTSTSGSSPAKPLVAQQQQQQPQSAVELYTVAVAAEREGRLQDALHAYRAAFRKDDNVDKAYHRLQSSIAARKERSKAAAAAEDDDGRGAARDGQHDDEDEDEDDLVFQYQRTLQIEPDYERQKQPLKSRMMTASYLDKLLGSFRDNPWDPTKAEHVQRIPPSSQLLKEEEKQQHHSIVDNQKQDTHLHFHPRIAGRAVPIDKLPDELLLHVLSFLADPSPNAKYPDVRSIERGFSLTCRRARILTLQSLSLWKGMATSVYRPPLQIESSAISAESVARRLYASDYRLMWIEHPRIRTDGVYISQITYLRRGAHDGTSHYDPTHLITYYRYLCFLPSGDVVSLLSHDVPSNVVPNLLSSSASSAKPQSGYTVGRWRLRHLASSSSSSLAEDDGNSNNNKSTQQQQQQQQQQTTPTTLIQLSSLEDPRIESPEDVKYSFKMICKLKSTARGRMNKLEMVSLTAKNHRTDEEAAIPIRQANNSMPSFYFSRVRSYD